MVSCPLFVLAVLSDQDKRSMYDAGFLDMFEEDEVRKFVFFFFQKVILQLLILLLQFLTSSTTAEHPSESDFAIQNYY